MERQTGVDDYVGEVGHERHAVHQTHFTAPGVKLSGELSTGYQWIYVGAGRYKRVKVSDEKHGA